MIYWCLPLSVLKEATLIGNTVTRSAIASHCVEATSSRNTVTRSALA